MNVNEAKTVLLLYRPGTGDAEDPQIAEALALAQHDPELAAWLEAHGARQLALGEKFRQIAVPAGLKEQIVSEQAACERRISRRPTVRLALAVIILLFGMLAVFWFSRRARIDTLAIYQNQMVGIALRGYGMDLVTNNPAQIRAHLAQHGAPSDYVLPAALQKAVVVGCALESWQNEKVSMICFRTGKKLAPGESSDLWLFVVDRTLVNDPSTGNSPHFSKVNRLITATWTQGDKLYLLGTEGDEQSIRKFL
ncbi:MAG TPA: hypothetical protein VIK53_00120 [Verrucomicrobiae bacterium]